MTDSESTAIWNDATWAGNRLRQHRDFLALSLREKVLALEEMERVAEALRIAYPRSQSR